MKYILPESKEDWNPHVITPGWEKPAKTVGIIALLSYQSRVYPASTAREHLKLQCALPYWLKFEHATEKHIT